MLIAKSPSAGFLKILLERFFHDIVVTMVLTLATEPALPRVAITQLGACNGLCHSGRSSNAAAMSHRKSVLFNLTASKVRLSVILRCL